MHTILDEDVLCDAICNHHGNKFFCNTSLIVLEGVPWVAMATESSV